MKHFANFAPSYNNIGLGIGAAVGLARGSGLIGESQEERDNTTGLGRLGKLAGYTGGGAALGAGTGMAVKAGTKYFRGRKRTVTEPNFQNPVTSTPEPVAPPPLAKPTGYRGLSKEARAEKLADRQTKWEHLNDENFDIKALGKAYNDPSLSQEDRNKIYKILEKESNYKNLLALQNNIKLGRYTKSTTNTRNF